MQTSYCGEMSEPTLRGYIDALRRDVVGRGSVHQDSALRAAHATSRRLSGEFGVRRLGRSDVRRVRAYFYAVLRNVALESAREADVALRDRLKVAALVADLRAVDASDECIRREVEVFFGSRALVYLADAVAVS